MVYRIIETIRRAQRISNDDLNGPCRASKFSREITESRNNGISVS